MSIFQSHQQGRKKVASICLYQIHPSVPDTSCLENSHWAHQSLRSLCSDCSGTGMGAQQWWRQECCQTLLAQQGQSQGAQPLTQCPRKQSRQDGAQCAMILGTLALSPVDLGSKSLKPFSLLPFPPLQIDLLTSCKAHFFDLKLTEDLPNTPSPASWGSHSDSPHNDWDKLLLLDAIYGPTSILQALGCPLQPHPVLIPPLCWCWSPGSCLHLHLCQLSQRT